MPAVRFSASRPADGTYVELVRSLFATIAPTAIMGILFVVVVSMAVARTPNRTLATLGTLGLLASLIRVAVVLGNERRMRGTEVDGRTAARVERLFAAAYLAFAALLGAFAAHALHVCDAEVQTVVATLVVGYAAGVAAGASLRPWIGVPAVLLAVVPPALSALTRGGMTHAVLALVLFALLAGGIGSMIGRYRSEADKIAMRHTFASLARTDHLTGLLNRFALDEAFARAVDGRDRTDVAVHCLDLDRFKQVNDTLGHPAGDLLLAEAADRLRSLCRGGDVAARLGGDEFALLQTGLRHAGEADLMARRIVRLLGEPYRVAGHRIDVGVSVGYATTEGGYDLGQLIARADDALYRIKREGGGAAAHDPAARALAAVG